MRSTSVWDVPENKRLARVLLDEHAPADELIAYAELELRDCMDSLEPMAPGNGRSVDGFHASCCAQRAIAALDELRRRSDDEDR